MRCMPLVEYLNMNWKVKGDSRGHRKEQNPGSEKPFLFPSFKGARIPHPQTI